MLTTTLLAALSLASAPQDQSSLAAIRAAVDKAISPLKTPAVLIAVARKDQVLLAEVRGKNGKNAANRTAIFPMGETSKVVSGLL